jgi:hypothetical protein
VTTEPAAAGLLRLFNDPSALRAFADPLPDPSADNNPNAVGATLTFKTFEAEPLILT